MNSKEFVSRAGKKLAAALSHFRLNVDALICADLGCSTGGFTDCLLQNGAAKVYAVDTGFGVLDWKLRNDPRVEVMERQNALHVTLPEKVDFVSVDVGWTRQRLILPVAMSLLKPKGNIISLLKPHYESPREYLDHGRLKDDKLENVVFGVISDLEKMNIHVSGITISPIVGDKGKNIEYLLWISKA